MKFKLIFLLTLLLFVTACSQLSPSPPTPTPTFTPVPTPTRTSEDILAEGWAAYEDGDFQTAEATANLLIERDETLPGPWALIGWVYFKDKDYEEALNNFNQAISLGLDDEDTFEAVSLIHVNYLMTSWDPDALVTHIAGAREVLLQLQEINPENPYVDQFLPKFTLEAEYGDDFSRIDPSAVDLFTQGESLSGTGTVEEALDFFSRATQADENFAMAYKRIGDIYYATDEFDLAIENYEQALSINPYLVDAWAKLGDSYAFLSLPKSARSAYLAALFLDPEYEYVLQNFRAMYTFMSNWVNLYFDPFGFDFYYPDDLEISVFEEPFGDPSIEQGAVSLSNDEYLIIVLWQDLKGEEPLPFERAVELARSPIETDPAMNLEGDPIEFKYGDVPIIIQLYTYTPSSDEGFTSSGAIVIPLCQTKYFSMQFEYLRAPLDEVIPNISLHLDLFSCGEE